MLASLAGDKDHRIGRRSSELNRLVLYWLHRTPSTVVQLSFLSGIADSDHPIDTNADLPHMGCSKVQTIRFLRKQISLLLLVMKSFR
jgi:hypothetical protein